MQEQVNATFISTVAEAVMKAGNALSVVNAGGQTSVEESLDTMQAQLQDYVVMLQSFQSIMTSAEMIMETSQNMLPDILFPFRQILMFFHILYQRHRHSSIV